MIKLQEFRQEGTSVKIDKYTYQQDQTETLEVVQGSVAVLVPKILPSNNISGLDY